MEAKDIKLTPARLVFLRTLKDGPKTWKDIKVAYYGPERAKSPSHTSFDNQCKKLSERGIITLTDGHYELTDLGRALLSIVDDTALLAAKTLAQGLFESKDNA